MDEIVTPSPSAMQAPPTKDVIERAFMHQRTLFATASSMVGVCLTAIGLVLVVERLSSGMRAVSRVVLGVDSLIFLAAAFLSFTVMRSQVRGKWSRLHGVAEIVMLLGLSGIVIVCLTLVLTFV